MSFSFNAVVIGNECRCGVRESDSVKVKMSESGKVIRAGLATLF